jgi:hypothetical protein
MASKKRSKHTKKIAKAKSLEATKPLKAIDKASPPIFT